MASAIVIRVSVQTNEGDSKENFAIRKTQFSFVRFLFHFFLSKQKNSKSLLKANIKLKFICSYLTQFDIWSFVHLTDSKIISVVVDLFVVHSEILAKLIWHCFWLIKSSLFPYLSKTHHFEVDPLTIKVYNIILVLGKPWYS